MVKQENLIYGLHAVNALLNKNPKRIVKIFLQQTRHDDRIKKIIQAASKHHIPIYFTTKQELQTLINHNQHQGIIAQIHATKPLGEADLKQILSQLTVPPFLLILDNIQDPHNLGACLRSADAAGVQAVIAPKDRSVGLTPTVKKIASGAAENIPFIQVTNLARTIRELQKQNIWIVGTAEEAKQSLFEFDLNIPLAIVMGSEEKGLRHLTKEYCDTLLHIPMFGSVSSLNVSVATGIFLFETVRQKHRSNLQR